MGEFIIKGSTDGSVIEFSDRLPEDPNVPIDSFAVRVSRCDLFAATRVWAHDIPVNWFKQIAADWKGWEGGRKWRSLDGELELSAKNSHGHVSFLVQIHPMEYDNDWRIYTWCVDAIVRVDAGQLDGFAKHAERFFGKEGFFDEY